MLNLGFQEIVVILFVALIFLGPNMLPEIASGLGKAIREVRKAAADIKNEIALDDAIRKPLAELREATMLPPEELKRRDERRAVEKRAEREEQERKAREEAEHRRVENEELKRREEELAAKKRAEREEQERKAREEAERKAREEAEHRRVESEERKRRDEERAAKKRAEREEQERKAQQAAERQRAEREEERRREEELAAQKAAKPEEQGRKARDEAAKQRPEGETAVPAADAAGAHPAGAGPAVSGVTVDMNPPPDSNRPSRTPTLELLNVTPDPVSVEAPHALAGARPPPVPATSLRSPPGSRLPSLRSSQADAKSPRLSPPPLPPKKG